MWFSNQGAVTTYIGAALAGAAAVIVGMSLPGGLGASSWSLVGIAAVWLPTIRKGRPPTVPGVVLGGVLGAAPLFALLLAVPDSGAITLAGAAVTFPLGAAMLLWGGNGLQPLLPAPRGDRGRT